MSRIVFGSEEAAEIVKKDKLFAKNREEIEELEEELAELNQTLEEAHAELDHWRITVNSLEDEATALEATIKRLKG
jgi:peptidoglycan hydrolase CwlO-like protein